MNHLFDTEIHFEKKALETFYFQSKNCDVYKQYLDLLNISPSNIKAISEIPFLPISFFKNHRIVCEKKSIQGIFYSSGTTGQLLSKHYITDLSIYEKSIINGFNYFFGNIQDYRILALVPSYQERKESSLVYMCQFLIDKSQDPASGFYLNNYNELSAILSKKTTKKTILIGVSYALLDLAEQFPQSLEDILIIETGGMKGQRPEMIKSELHSVLKKAFVVDKILSEYGMTELLSQAYSFSDGIFQTPPWMKVFIRDAQDPLALLNHQQIGGINIIDLANINSCSFIATQDIGKTINDTHFELFGRFEMADIRGCNLLVQ